ncbi:hypothetical protein BDQ17DRAFT_282645 [Cyathus striatus]|nr:hypothetical protein BDQ17DRAFT_282645 [Cyathus striatus]
MDNHNAAAALVLDAVLSVQDRIRIAIEHLPHLSLDQFHLDESCPICLFSFQTILSQNQQFQDIAITKVPGCGHVFCRKDLCEWIRSQVLT